MHLSGCIDEIIVLFGVGRNRGRWEKGGGESIGKRKIKKGG